MSEILETPGRFEESPASVEPQERKRRGRPRKGSPDGALPGTSSDTANANAQEKPKRRKKGNATSDEINQRAQLLAGAHFTLAMFTGAKEFMLSEHEALSLASASLNVEAEFDLQLSPKMLAVGSLFAALGAIYIPKVGAMATRLKREREQAEAEAALGVRGDVAPSQTNPQG